MAVRLRLEREGTGEILAEYSGIPESVAAQVLAFIGPAVALAKSAAAVKKGLSEITAQLPAQPRPRGKR